MRVRPVGDGSVRDCSYAAEPTRKVESIRLLDDLLWVTDTEGGYAVVPVPEGLLVPADNGVAFTHRFDTYAYEGCHMAMLGVMKSAALNPHNGSGNAPPPLLKANLCQEPTMRLDR